MTSFDKILIQALIGKTIQVYKMGSAFSLTEFTNIKGELIDVVITDVDININYSDEADLCLYFDEGVISDLSLETEIKLK